MGEGKENRRRKNGGVEWGGRDMMINMTEKISGMGWGWVGEEAGADLSKSRVTLGSRTRFCFHYL